MRRTAVVVPDLVGGPDVLLAMTVAGELAVAGLQVDVLVHTLGEYDTGECALPFRVLSANRAERIQAFAPYYERVIAANAVVAGVLFRQCPAGRLVQLEEEATIDEGHTEIMRAPPLAPAKLLDALPPLLSKGRLIRVLLLTETIDSGEALEALAALRSINNLEIWVAGVAGGGCHGPIRAAALFGALQPRQYGMLFKSCDLVIPLGAWRSSGSALLQAMICKCVPVVSATTSLPAFCRSGRTALMYDSLEPKEVAGLLRLAADLLPLLACEVSIVAAKAAAEGQRRFQSSLWPANDGGGKNRPKRRKTAGRMMVQGARPSPELVTGIEFVGWLARREGGDVAEARLRTNQTVDTPLPREQPRPGVAEAFGVPGVYGFAVSASWRGDGPLELIYAVEPGATECVLPIDLYGDPAAQDEHIILHLEEPPDTAPVIIDLDAQPELDSLTLEMIPGAVVKWQNRREAVRRLTIDSGVVTFRLQDLLSVTEWYR